MKLNDFTKLFSRQPKTIVVGGHKDFNTGPNSASDAAASASAKLSKPSIKGSVDEGYLDAYADSAWVYACVSRKAQDAASLPLKLYKRGSKEDTVVDKHDALTILSEVNEQMTQYDLMEWMYSSLELAGNFYCGLFDFDKSKKSLLPYIPALITPIASADARVMISGYTYKVDNSTKTIKPEEMLHIKYYNPLLSGYVTGLSPLTAARQAYETDDRALKWNLNNLKKGLTANGALKTENPYFNDATKRKEALDSWKQNNTGADGDRVGILYGGLDWKEFGITPRDMQFLNQRKATREEILAVYKVPPAVLGLFEYANYANAEMQEKFYWRNGVIPMLRKAEGGLTEKFLPKFKGSENMYFKHDLSGVAVLQDNEDAKSITAARFFSMGVPYNKIAEALKLPIKNIEGGDKGYLPFSLQEVGAEEPRDPAQDEAGKGRKVLKSKLTEEQKLIKWTGFIKVADKYESRMKLAVQKFFSHQELDVLAELKGGKRLGKKGIDDAMFDADKEAEKLLAKLKGIYEQIIQKQAQQEIENFNFNISFDLTNPRVAEWIEGHGLDACNSINETTKDALRKTLAEGVDAGESMTDLAKRVSEVYSTARESRSMLIARTETIAASNQGALESYKQTGLNIKKGWLAANDERTRDTHIEAGKEYDDAGAIQVDADFYVGTGHGSAPGQIGAPEEDCNCRCSIYPVIGE